MAALTPISRKPLSLVLPTIAAAGGLLGLFVGTANNSGFMGVLIGALLVAGLGALYILVLKNEQIAKWISLLVFVALGFVFGGIPGAILGAVCLRFEQDDFC